MALRAQVRRLSRLGRHHQLPNGLKERQAPATVKPTYIAFDLLFVDGEDIRTAPLKERKALLEKVVRRYGLERTEPFIGEGRPLFRAVCRLDLERIVAKRMADTYGPQTKWWKIPNPDYSQKEGRAELFERRYA